MYYKLGFFLFLGLGLGAFLGPPATHFISSVWADDDDDDDDDEDDKVHDLMEKIHSGKKSPWKLTERAVSADAVDWNALGKAVPRFSDMSKALLASKNEEIRDSADGYAQAAQDLAQATKVQDGAAARSAFKTLANSCSDCHFKGGPGGKLDD